MATYGTKLWGAIKSGAGKAVNYAKKNPVNAALRTVNTLYPTALGGTGLIAQFLTTPTSKSKSTKKKTKDPKTVYNGATTYEVASGDGSDGYSSSGGGGGYSSSASRVPDISGLLAAYDQQADASRKIAQNSYDTTRNDLLTSLKRFQEQNAKDVENQKQGYLAEQSGLDYAREQANRQNRVAASARGLGGSGLQQLAQLQTLMSQGEDISQAAASNQKAMDALRQALQQKEDDTNTNLSKAQSTLDSTLAQIEANLAQQKAQAIYENEMAKASGGSGGYSGGGSGSSSGFDAGLSGLLNAFNSQLATYGGLSEEEAVNNINNLYERDYGHAKDLKQAKTILSSVFADNLSKAIGNRKVSSGTIKNAINQSNTYLSNLKTSNKKTSSKKSSSKKKKK